jgi:hypothetical protein
MYLVGLETRNRIKKEKRTGSRTPGKSVIASVLDATNSVLDSGQESYSRHICDFAHSLKANILIVPAPLASYSYSVLRRSSNDKHGNYQRIKIIPVTKFAIRDMECFL